MLHLLVPILLLLQLIPSPGVPVAELVVTLRDVSGKGVAGVTVVVRNSTGDAVLDRATTDGEGTVTIAALAPEEVRVVVIGTLGDGTGLAMEGADARGIRVFLDAQQTELALRVEANGRVIIDPAAFVVERAGATASPVVISPYDPFAAIPPAPTAASLPTLTSTAPALPVAPQPTVAVVGLPERPLVPAAAPDTTSPVLAILLLLVAGAGVLVVAGIARRGGGR